MGSQALSNSLGSHCCFLYMSGYISFCCCHCRVYRNKKKHWLEQKNERKYIYKTYLGGRAMLFVHIPHSTLCLPLFIVVTAEYLETKKGLLS